MQTTVSTEYAIGVPGDPATPHSAVYYPLNLSADSSGVYAGTFVQRDSDDCATNTITAPLGLVQRNLSYPTDSITTNGSLKIAAGQPVMIAVKGDFYVKTLTAATVGQKVFAVSADGTIKTGTSGGTVTGAVETDWKVVTAGAANSTIIISNL